MFNLMKRLLYLMVKTKHLADIAFTQTRRQRPFLKSSRLGEPGLCCWMDNMSMELLDITVRRAIAKHAKGYAYTNCVAKRSAILDNSALRIDPARLPTYFP
jgi:hypothetical protein